MAKTVNNTQVDALAAAVATPYGPLTRDSGSDYTAMPVPNSNIRGKFTSAFSVVVYLSPEELENPGLTNAFLERAHSWTAVVADFKTAITGLNTLASGMSTPHEYADYVTLVDYIRDNMPWIRGIVG